MSTKNTPVFDLIGTLIKLLMQCLLSLTYLLLQGLVWVLQFVAEQLKAMVK